MMKNNIGILTFHYAHNYGAVLQTYALRRVLEANGCNVQVINYQNKAIASVYDKKLKYEYKLKDLFRLRSLTKIFKSFFNTKYAQRQWSLQHEKFKKFIAIYLLDNINNIIQFQDLKRLNFNILIAGSDQIWNKHLTNGNDPAYFLDFATYSKKVFYGASNGLAFIPKEDIEFYCNAMSSAHAISTRENALSLDIIKHCHVNASSVLDPTLLLEQQDYEELIPDKPSCNRFVFAYFVSEDDTMTEISNYISRSLKIPLYELHYYKTLKLKNKNQRADMGPQEFLYHIKNADFVITNSFHGTVFSVIFKKKFYSVYNNDQRKDELLTSLNLSSRKIQNKTQIDLNASIEYTNVITTLNALRKNSYKFINEAINIK